MHSNGTLTLTLLLLLDARCVHSLTYRNIEKRSIVNVSNYIPPKFSKKCRWLVQHGKKGHVTCHIWSTKVPTCLTKSSDLVSKSCITAKMNLRFSIHVPSNCWQSTSHHYLKCLGFSILCSLVLSLATDRSTCFAAAFIQKPRLSWFKFMCLSRKPLVIWLSGT